MKSLSFLLLFCVPLGGCSTLDKSMHLGGILGSIGGATATYVADQSAGGSPTLKSVGLGASIGMAVGLITSYLIHDSVVKDREDSTRQTEVYFGDLPPSPFVIPNNTRKGKR